MTTPKVYTAIAAVQGKLAHTGIQKNRRNQQQGYAFRGIDDVYAALSPLLAEHKLCVIPRCLERECVEGQTRKGDPLFRVTVKAEFDFVSAEDGSKHTCATFGEAMDSADKATNKAMSAAYKYAAFMTFAIPTEGDEDAEATTPEAAPKAAASDDLEPQDGWGAWALDLQGKIATATSEAEVDKLRDDQTTKRRINALRTLDQSIYQSIGKSFADKRAALAPKKEMEPA